MTAIIEDLQRRLFIVPRSTVRDMLDEIARLRRLLAEHHADACPALRPGGTCTCRRTRARTRLAAPRGQPLPKKP